MAAKSDSRLRSLAVEVGRIYRGMFHVYRSWWTEIIVLSLIIFVPLGLLDAADASALDSIGPGQDFKLLALLAGALVITATSMLGEVFLAGAVGLSLTHAENGRPPSLRFLARRLKYGRLIAIDLTYVLVVAIGLVLLFVPGFAALVYLALAGPVAETEDRRFRDSFRRSFQLIRGNFWLVFWVIVPIELFGGTIQNGIESMLDFVLGESFIALGLTEALANVVISPLFAIAAVLLTRRLVLLKDGVELPGPGPNELRRPGTST
jgi:hypothetical protein